MQDFLVASTGATSGEQHRFQDVLPLPRAGGPAPIQPLSCVSPKIWCSYVTGWAVQSGFMPAWECKLPENCFIS